MTKKLLTADRLRDVLNYDPESGVFTWRISRKKCTAGAAAGSKRPDGYVLIRVDYIRYYGHRLAWLYMMGEWPKSIIDHIDGNPTNNSLVNLRTATPRQSSQNRRVQSNNRTGLKGVRRSSCGFYSMIKAGHEVKYLGSFKTASAAYGAYRAAADEYFGEFNGIKAVNYGAL